MSIWKSCLNNQIKVTNYGGIAVKAINDTGVESQEGMVVSISESIECGVILTPIDSLRPIGVILDGGVPNGECLWVSISGYAKVYFSNAVSRGDIARVALSTDIGAEVGEAVSSPSTWLSNMTDPKQLLLMIGHISETILSEGLALVNLQFN